MPADRSPALRLDGRRQRLLPDRNLVKAVGATLQGFIDLDDLEFLHRLNVCSLLSDQFRHQAVLIAAWVRSQESLGPSLRRVKTRAPMAVPMVQLRAREIRRDFLRAVENFGQVGQSLQFQFSRRHCLRRRTCRRWRREDAAQLRREVNRPERFRDLHGLASTFRFSRYGAQSWYAGFPVGMRRLLGTATFVQHADALWKFIRHQIKSQ